jgi:hypothetical protein
VGTLGYRRASDVTYREGEVILEVGSGESTRYLADVGPIVVTIDADPRAYDRVRDVANVEAYCDRAEDFLRGWRRSIGFAWLDGYDWPYRGNPPSYYDEQRAWYRRSGYEYSREESRRIHLVIAHLVEPYARVVAFDDTWRTHAHLSDSDGRCVQRVPPATAPAPMLAMNEPIDRSVCGLDADHPHHDDPDRGWNGKGGTAISYLLDRGFEVRDHGLCLVVLSRNEDDL